MAIQYIGTAPVTQVSYFVGLSTDTPTASHIPYGGPLVAGSIIYDMDTPGTRKYTGSAWIQDTTAGAASTAARMQEFNVNTSTWENRRNNTEFTALASSIRTASINSADFTNFNFPGVILFFNITAVPGVDSVTLSLQIKDPVSGEYGVPLSGAARTGTGLTTAALYPNVTGGFTTIVSGVLSRTFRIAITHSGAGSFAYSVGGVLVV